MMQVLIPMSGQGKRFKKAGYALPKPLIPVSGTAMLQRLLQEIPQDWPCTFVIAQSEKGSALEDALKTWRPLSQIVVVPDHQEGPGRAIEAALEKLDLHKPVLISYCDYGLKWNPLDFEKFVAQTNCDTCVVSYRGFHAHYLNPQMYAYSRLEKDLVKEIKEKGCFTDNRENEFASCGAYYFKDISDLKKALQYQRQEKLIVQGELYTSLTVEALLRLKPQTQCRIYEIDTFYQWGTPQDVQDFEYWEKTFLGWQNFLNSPLPSVAQLLMPMAGRGSRLSTLFAQAKPLIPIGTQALYRWALNSFPQSKKTVFVTLNSIAEKMRPLENETVISVAETPPGQALSTELGLKKLNATKDVIVTACDHMVVMDPELWQKFIAHPDCDAAIFTVQGFPGTHRRPTAFSYVQSETSEPFSLVTSVSVKKPLTEFPSKEDLLVGSFWFKNPGIAQKGIDLLKEAQVHVNGELYLDSIFTHLMANGFKVRRFPLQGYINWGDIESYKESRYWYEKLMGVKL